MLPQYLVTPTFFGGSATRVDPYRAVLTRPFSDQALRTRVLLVIQNSQNTSKDGPEIVKDRERGGKRFELTLYHKLVISKLTR